MRVVLKPGGVVLILIALSMLTYFAVVGKAKPRQKATIVSPARGGFVFGSRVIVATPSSAPVESPVNSPTTVSATNLLRNGDFEGEFVPARPDMERPLAHIGGDYASGWGDSSGWADLSVSYDRDENNPHSGKVCQKIVVPDIKKGQAQFIQYVAALPGKQVYGSLWIRAEKPTSVQLILRDSLEYKSNYGVKEATVSTEWQRLEVSGTVTNPNTVTLLLAVRQVGTVWVDDASMEIVP